MTAADPLRDKAQLRKTLRRARMALPRAYRQQAARAIAIDLMGTLSAACGGDLGRVKRIVETWL